jgi:hypothetical protein
MRKSEKGTGNVRKMREVVGQPQLIKHTVAERRGLEHGEGDSPFMLHGSMATGEAPNHWRPALVQYSKLCRYEPHQFRSPPFSIPI